MENIHREKLTYSIILATLYKDEKHKETIIECLDAIKKNTNWKDTELIISDDGSPLDSEFLRERADIYVRRKKPYGCAYGWNHGLKLASGDYLIVISDDVTVVSGWIEAMREALDKFHNALVSAPAVAKMPNGEGIVECRTWFPGSCFMLRREALDIVGYFDQRFRPFNYEDVDYWTRVAKSGHTVARNYNVMVDHKEGEVIHSIKDNGSVDNDNRDKYLKKWGFDPIPILYHGHHDFPWEQ